LYYRKRYVSVWTPFAKQGEERRRAGRKQLLRKFNV